MILGDGVLADEVLGDVPMFGAWYPEVLDCEFDVAPTYQFDVTAKPTYELDFGIEPES